RARFQETLYDRHNWEFAFNNIIEQLQALTGSDDPYTVDVVGRGLQIAALYLRGARILQQEAPEDARLLPMLFKCLDARPDDQEAAFMAETILAVGGHLQHIQQLQDRRASLIADPAARVRLLAHFGDIWQVRLQNPEMAAYFYRQALEIAYDDATAAFRGHLAAFRAGTIAAAESGQVAGIVPLAERGLSMLDDVGDATVIALQAGGLAWRSANDVETARRLLGFAAHHAASHPVVVAFEQS